MIPAIDKYFSFGRYLQTCRLQKGMDLATLAGELKINADILTAIENEDYANMPESVYIKGFLRSFAGAVDADADIAVQSYVDSLTVFNKIRQAESSIDKENEQFWPRLGISTGVLLVLIVLTIFFLGGIENTAPEHHSNTELTSSLKEAPPPDSEVETPSPPVSSPYIAPEAESAMTVSGKNSDTLMLAIDTLEETWIKIIIDNQKPNEYTLQPGDHLELGATSRFNLLVGNATGVELFINGKRAPISGQQGEVINIEIP